MPGNRHLSLLDHSFCQNHNTSLYFNHQESEQSDSIALLESDARDAEEEEVITVEMIDDNIEKTPDTVEDDTSPDTGPLSSPSDQSGHRDKQTRAGSETKLFLRRLVGVRDEVSQYIVSIYVMMYLEMARKCEWLLPVYWK